MTVLPGNKKSYFKSKSELRAEIIDRANNPILRETFGAYLRMNFGNQDLAQLSREELVTLFNFLLLQQDFVARPYDPHVDRLH